MNNIYKMPWSDLNWVQQQQVLKAEQICLTGNSTPIALATVKPDTFGTTQYLMLDTKNRWLSLVFNAQELTSVRNAKV